MAEIEIEGDAYYKIMVTTVFMNLSADGLPVLFQFVNIY